MGPFTHGAEVTDGTALFVVMEPLDGGLVAVEPLGGGDRVELPAGALEAVAPYRDPRRHARRAALDLIQRGGERLRGMLDED